MRACHMCLITLQCNQLQSETVSYKRAYQAKRSNVCAKHELNDFELHRVQ